MNVKNIYTFTNNFEDSEWGYPNVGDVVVFNNKNSSYFSWKLATRSTVNFENSIENIFGIYAGKISYMNLYWHKILLFGYFDYCNNILSPEEPYFLYYSSHISPNITIHYYEPGMTFFAAVFFYIGTAINDRILFVNPFQSIYNGCKYFYLDTGAIQHWSTTFSSENLSDIGDIVFFIHNDEGNYVAKLPYGHIEGSIILKDIWYSGLNFQTIGIVDYIEYDIDIKPNRIYFIDRNAKGHISEVPNELIIGYGIKDLGLFFNPQPSIKKFYGFFAGGFANAWSNEPFFYSNSYSTIDCINLLTLATNVIHTASLQIELAGLTGVVGNNLGFFGGGMSESGQYDELAFWNIIQKIDILTTSVNCIAKSGFEEKAFTAGISGPNYGFFCGGLYIYYKEHYWYSPHDDEWGLDYIEDFWEIYNSINYIDILTTIMNVSNRGNLVHARYGACGLSGPQYGIIVGGHSMIEWINLLTFIGNASDRCAGPENMLFVAGVSGPQYGFFINGNISSPIFNIDLLTLSSNIAKTYVEMGGVPRGLTGVSGNQYGFFAPTGFDTITGFDITMPNSIPMDADKGSLSIQRYNMGGIGAR